MSGRLLREWRQRRRMSQLDLACDAQISVRRLIALETGHAAPDQGVLLHLAECLGMPLRVQNQLLRETGLVPTYQERDFLAPAMAVARRNVEVVLAAHDPHPAMAINRHWVMLSANKAVANLVAGAESVLLRPPVNLLRLLLHPAGLASRIVNLMEWRAHIAARLRRDIDVTGDPALVDLLEEMRDYPNPVGQPPPSAGDSSNVAMPFRLETIDGTLSFFCITTRFATPMDITLAEMAIEAFLPADHHTAAILRRTAGRPQAPLPPLDPVPFRPAFGDPVPFDPVPAARRGRSQGLRKPAQAASP